MPHAVIAHAREAPAFDAPLSHEGGRIFRVVEAARSEKGWLLKCLIAHAGFAPRKFIARLDEREDGFVARLDDHVPVERDDEVFRFLATLTEAVLRANPGSRVTKTNLEKWLPPGTDVEAGERSRAAA